MLLDIVNSIVNETIMPLQNFKNIGERNQPEKGFFTANELVAVDEDTRYVTEKEHKDNADEKRGKVHFFLH